MPGVIRLAYARDPDWFKGQDALGHFHQTVVGLDERGAVAGAGVRAIRTAYVDGKPCEIGCLSGLRSLAGVRRGLGLAQGYRFLRRLHQTDLRTPVYLTTILESNTPAQALLTSGRAGLPRYHDLGRVNTYLWTQPSGARADDPPNVAFRILHGRPDAGLVDFLKREGSKRLFFPCVDGPAGTCSPWGDFSAVDFCVAERAGEIVGLVGQWDQRASRQIRVVGYAPALSRLRPAVNAFARMIPKASLPRLPRPGEPLAACFATLVCVKEDDPRVFASIMRRLGDHARARGFSAFIVSLHERASLNAALSRWDHRFACRSRLYCACWEDGEAFYQALDPEQVPYVDGGML